MSRRPLPAGTYNAFTITELTAAQKVCQLQRLTFTSCLPVGSFIEVLIIAERGWAHPEEQGGRAGRRCG